LKEKYNIYLLGLETENPLVGLVSDFKRQAWEMDTYKVAKVKENEEGIKKLITIYQPAKDSPTTSPSEI